MLASGATALGSVHAPLQKPCHLPRVVGLCMLLACLDNLNYDLASMNPDEFSDEHIPLGYLITIRA